MAINPRDFNPRPGFVNKQGCLPDPTELCCIQVPKVFDQCLIKRCLKPGRRPWSDQLCEAIPEITSEADIKNIGCCRDFEVTINSVTKCPIKSQPGYKSVTVNFTVSFKVDVETTCGCETLDYSVDQTVTIGKLYCPCPIAQISMVSNGGDPDNTEEMIKIEVISDCLKTEVKTIGGYGSKNDTLSEDSSNENDEKCYCTPKVYLCITLGLFIIVKCELKVQLLIPAYGYCPIPDECAGVAEDACKTFLEGEVPDFYPPQKMDNLFCNECED